MTNESDTIHRAWKKNRDAAVAEFFGSFESFKGTSASGDNLLLLSFATLAAVCAEEHEAAADGYFQLASLTRGENNEPSSAGQLWYTRSLDHARRQENDFAIARAAYCLGCIEASAGLHDPARDFFFTARDHADKAGNPGGKAAALYRLARVAVAESDFKAATDYGLDSYFISRTAKQIRPAAETLALLFPLWNQFGMDSLAIKPAVDILSLATQAAVNGDVAAARNTVAVALRAISALDQATRDEIMSAFAETWGEEAGNQIRNELDTLVATLKRPE